MKQKTAARLLRVLILANLALIWGNSAMTGQQSGEMSGSVLVWVCKILPVFAGENGHLLLRKIAHFSEFACLGLLTGADRLMRAERLEPGHLGLGLAAACIDETIQLSVPGRASSLIDVWIDAVGFAAGSAAAAAWHGLRKKCKKSKIVK